MDLIARLNDAVSYLEERLTEEIEYEHMSQLACSTTYQFQRIFSYLSGVTLSEYIRRRRMSLAVADLLAGEKIIDVAAKYSYASPTAFNRAFQSVHGVAPSRVNEPGLQLKSYPPVRFKLTLTGVSAMNYRIETHPEMRAIGRTLMLERSLEQNFGTVPGFWGKAGMDGTIMHLAQRMGQTLPGLLGLCNCPQEGDWTYSIAVVSDAEPPEGMCEIMIPAVTYAIFSGEGACPSAIQELMRRIYSEWLPESGFACAAGMDIERYMSEDMDDAKFEVWIPVVKKV